MEIDREEFIANLGGAAAVNLMDSETKADALEDYMSDALDEAVESNAAVAPTAQKKFPTAAEIEAQIPTRTFRRGVGNLFAQATNVQILEPLPVKPTLLDYFRLRFAPANHVLQSAALAMKNGMSEEIILACLLHDTVQALIKTDHGWWGAQLYEPYVSEKVAFAIRYHQTLRYYPDTKNGYEYPDLYRNMFGEDYKPPEYIEKTYKMLLKHQWYMLPRLVTVNDLYAFDPNQKVTIEPFLDIIGRQFKQPKEGLGFDSSPVAHMWRTIARPDQPL
ncbi:MAG TPA: hypothetical protein VN841_13795 [Bryobacteraceae bacterium]|nr:hypothetical protein [Bryobacteraceae bacterium]